MAPTLLIEVDYLELRWCSTITAGQVSAEKCLIEQMGRISKGKNAIEDLLDGGHARLSRNSLPHGRAANNTTLKLRLDRRGRCG